MNQLRLLGMAMVAGPDGPCAGPVAQRHRIALLALLAANGPVAQSRDWLLAMLWPEQDTCNARQLLNLSVHVVRQALGRSTLRTVGDALLLDTALLPTDLTSFESALADGRTLAALRHYGGRFLHGFFLPRAPEFEQWADGVRMTVARRRAEVLRGLAVERERANDWRQAVTWWREVLVDDPGSGVVACALMRALASAGDRAGAIQAGDAHVLFMTQELDAEPDAEVTSLARSLRSPVVTPASRNAPAEILAPIIAVKPFLTTEGVGPPALGESVARELIVSLTGSSRVRIATNVDAPGVDLILEGTLSGADDRIRATANLIDARQGLHRWSLAFDHRTAARFTLAEELAGIVAADLLAWLGGGPPPLPGAELGGSELLLRGRYALGRRTPDGFRTALRYFGRAVETAPGDTMGHASLAETYALMGWHEALPPTDAFASARQAATEALRVGPRNPAALATLAYAELQERRDWDGAEARFRQAIRLGPHLALPHQWFGAMLVAAGRMEEAMREMGIASRLDPLSLAASAAQGWACYHAGQPADAVAHCDRTLELDPNFAPAQLWRGLALGELGEWEAAIGSLRAAREQFQGAGQATSALAYALARGGRRQEAEEVVEGLTSGTGYLPAHGIAAALAALGRTDMAFQWLERAADERSHPLLFLRVDPQLRALREHPGFTRLADRMLIPTSGAAGIVEVQM